MCEKQGILCSKICILDFLSTLDEYDDYGNYIGDNPKYMNDFEEESDTEGGDEEEK